MNVIEINGLKKYYGKQRGVEEVSLSVTQGEIFGFIGPNGAGKSTTIRTMLSLIHPTAGEISLFGMDIRKNTTKIAQRIGYLPSEVAYYDGMTVKELLDYSSSFYKKDCSGRIRELASVLELDLHKKIEDLSYGNRKKVGIVQGLLHDPDLIILDEPTGGLDPLIQQKFFALLQEENEKGKTIFFSSHILSEVQRLCHRVAIIKEGRILKVSTMKSLREENYKKFTLATSEPARGLFENLPGVKDLVETGKDGNELKFMYQGNLKEILPLLGQTELQNLLIEEPSLEEIFLHYYEKEAE